MEVPDTRFARAPDGAYIAYQVVGRGPDLVYLRGDWSSSDFSWESPLESRFLSALAGFSRLILLDRRGTGSSDVLHDDRSTPFEVQVGDIVSVLDAVESSSASVFGWFESGPLCLLFAATHPDRTASLILYATYARGAWAPDYPWAWTDEEFQADIDRIEQGIRSGWAGDDYYGNWLKEFVPSLVDDPASRTWLLRHFRLGHGPGASLARLRMEHEVDVRSVLPTIRVPTLVMNRREDRVADFEEGRWLSQQISGASFIELDGIDNPPWAGDQGAILREIGKFLGVTYEPVVANRVLATVLFTDIVGSTEHLVTLGDVRWKDLLASHDDIAKKEIERHRGRYIDSSGDGLLATLDGPALAVECAKSISEGLRPLGIKIRAGVHTGEVELVAGGVRGITVHIGARVAALAGPGEVLVSQTVKDLSAGSGLTFEDAGEHELKGVPNHWRIYRVLE
jgi:class 3 adenylate cyclase/pimeloyl-ACP methyl ester carboxylesterase